MANDDELKSKFVCGVNCHPSLGLEGFFDRDPAALADKVTVPQLLLSSGNEPEYARAGGAVENKLKANKTTVKVVDFGDMKHGW